MRRTCAAPGHSRYGAISALLAARRVSMRPCPLSRVSALRRSGGGLAGSPQGGKVAEAFGDGVVQRWLVPLHCEQVMPSTVVDVLTDLALAKDGVARDDRAAQRQALEQRKRGGDLVLLGLADEIDDEIAGHGRKRWGGRPPTASMCQGSGC